uniref:Uncharacterized protein n=1 Tax=Arundo donax TaxID=35708 RepID=A0A0A9HE22_ARUDO
MSMANTFWLLFGYLVVESSQHTSIHHLKW